MSVPLWVATLADAFWEAAGMREPFPRNLRRPIARALPVMVVSFPGLHLRDVRDWCAGQGLGFPCAATDRRLFGFLLARNGGGCVFLDGAGPEDEQRLTLAHELAHFLRHYWQPRAAVSARLGQEALAVLDGQRPPTAAERVGAVLAGVPVGVHYHLLERTEETALPAGTVAGSEDEADRLAYELLAPAEEVLARAGEAMGEDLAEILRGEFGLPVAHARRYGAVLRPAPVLDPILGRLGLV